MLDRQQKVASSARCEFHPHRNAASQSRTGTKDV